MTVAGSGGAGRVNPWTSPADIAARARRRWEDGTVARAIAAGLPFEPITVALRGPRAGEIGDDLAAVRAWIRSLTEYDGPRYTLRWTSIGGRSVGRNKMPTHAVVESVAQLEALLGIRTELRRLRAVVDLVGGPGGGGRAASGGPLGDGGEEGGERQGVVIPGDSGARRWVLAHPLQALGLAGEFPHLLAAYRWLDEHRGSERYLREISAPGVDTKFAERHRAVLAAMLGVPATSGGFTAGLGLARKPDFVRMRLAPPLRLADGLSEMYVRDDELAALDFEPSSVLVVENEETYLAVPVPEDGAVFWGRGFAVDLVGSLPWLAMTPVRYWGDLDTHGFAILDRLRAHLPQVQSVLMDSETLLGHRDRWVTEDKPTSRDLPRLTAAERAVYEGLVTDAWGTRVRLEQENIDWQWALSRLR